ncbi:MAG TPA: choice-of-anchor tandem repeat NxxGxxAF-containing protein [Acidobacteriota bacterium]|nr:choice-of-anchor tandem repeat NxxGxxAF-containing protein [Acidobacteriota bacterium]
MPSDTLQIDPPLYQTLSLNNLGEIAFESRSKIFLFSMGSISAVTTDSFSGPSLNGNGSVAFAKAAFGGHNLPTVPREIHLFSDARISQIYPTSSGAALSFPSLNDRGEIVFSILENTTSRVTLFSSGSLSAVASRGDIAPDTGGQQFVLFLCWNAIRLNDSGMIAFTASIVTSQDTDGIFFFDGKIIRKVATRAAVALARNLVPDEAPGTGGGRFSAFPSFAFKSYPLSLTNSGALAFIAHVEGGTASSGIFWSAPPPKPRRRP